MTKLRKASLYKEVRLSKARGSATQIVCVGMTVQRPALGHLFRCGRDYMGRRFSMFSILESVELRPAPLSVTRSLMRMLGLVPAVVAGGGVLPSLRAVEGGARGAA
jgi:hypothetical protein